MFNNTKEIFEALAKGHKITSKAWYENTYIYLNSDGKLVDEKGNSNVYWFQEISEEPHNFKIFIESISVEAKWILNNEGKYVPVIDNKIGHNYLGKNTLITIKVL